MKLNFIVYPSLNSALLQQVHGGLNKSLWSSLQPKQSQKLRFFVIFFFSTPKNSKIFLTDPFFTDSGKSATSMKKNTKSLIWKKAVRTNFKDF